MKYSSVNAKWLGNLPTKSQQLLVHIPVKPIKDGTPKL